MCPKKHFLGAFSSCSKYYSRLTDHVVNEIFISYNYLESQEILMIFYVNQTTK